jgi:hypothetical protein
MPAAGAAVPVAGFVAMAATIAFGLTATAGGSELGTPLAPFLFDWAPRLHPSAAVAAVLCVGGPLAAPRLLSARVRPLRFAAAILLFGLALRLALAAARDGIDGWYAVYQLPNFEAASEYLPALPALGHGVRLFLDTFAEVGPSLSVNAIGHPPGLLVTLHLLGITTAEGMAALTIAGGVLSIPLTYLLARRLLPERSARIAALLYVFAPAAVLYGATSADALYATLALAAAIPLLARRRRDRAWGGPALAVASFFSYANLAIGAWAAILTTLRRGLRPALALAAGCAVALVAVYGVLHGLTGFDPIGALRSTESVYREGIASTRPYAFWVLGSPTAFLIAAGIPIAWLALRALGRGAQPAVAVFAVLAIAAVLGFTKAETERIYLFLVPLLCIAAASAVDERRLTPLLGALAAQALATELLFWTIW